MVSPLAAFYIGLGIAVGGFFIAVGLSDLGEQIRKGIESRVRPVDER